MSEGSDSEIRQIGVTRLPEELDGADEGDIELTPSERCDELCRDGARELYPGLIFKA